MEPQPQQSQSLRQSLRNAGVVRYLIIGLLALLLLIPLTMIDGLVDERGRRQYEVDHSIGKALAGRQTLTGPLIYLEIEEQYTTTVTQANALNKQAHNKTHRQLVFPHNYQVDANLQIEERKLGIYKIPAYHTSLAITGDMRIPTLETFRSVKDSELKLVKASLLLGLSDTKGFSAIPHLQWGEQSLEFAAGSEGLPDFAGIHARLDPTGLPGSSFKFATEIPVVGIDSLAVTPIGVSNQIKLQGNWQHPNFSRGDFLPGEHKISEQQFSASWLISALATQARQQLHNQIINGQLGSVQAAQVSLVNPINIYSLTNRALKYSFLFVGIIFGSILLLELTRKLRIHPVQYGLLGLAQAMFFLLLLSLGEVVGFDIAYWLGALACVALTRFYLGGALRDPRQANIFAGLIGSIYAVLFMILKSEDFALMAGSLFLFALLVIAMIATRKLNWQQP